MEEFYYELRVKVSVWAPDKDMADVFVSDYFGVGPTDGTVEITEVKIKNTRA